MNINEGAVKFNDGYLNKFENIIDSYLDEYLIYCYISNGFILNLHDFIKQIPDYNLLKMSPKAMDYAMRQIFNELFNTFINNIKSKVPNINTHNINWNNNDMFSVDFNTANISYKFVWKKKYSYITQIKFSFLNDIPNSYSNYIIKNGGIPGVTIHLILSDFEMGGKTLFPKDDIEGYILYKSKTDVLMAINTYHALSLMNVNKIKNRLMSVVKHESTHILQMYGKFGKDMSFGSYSALDIYDKYSKVESETQGKLVDDLLKMNKNYFENVYPVSLR